MDKEALMAADGSAKNRYTPLLLLVLSILAVFLLRALLARSVPMPRTFDVLNTLSAAGALYVVVRYHSTLNRADGLTALALGAVVGAGMLAATLFSPYPFLGVVESRGGQALIRGALTAITALAGLSIMRRAGPVTLHAANADWKRMGLSLSLGLGVGLPLAVLNVFALQFTQGQSIQWQNPAAALLDALQPGIVEEVVYRFALWGMLWCLLRRSLPGQAPWLAGLLAMLAHNFSHFDDLFLQSPLMALGMGLVMMLLWGLPPLLLARKRGLESALAFHWIQDAARFLTGF